MEHRDDLREVLWSNAGIQDRVEAFNHAISRFKTFDPMDTVHLGYIDGRLNQNIFLGKSYEYLDNEYRSFAEGETLEMAAVAWVPRFLWEDKPSVGGTEILREYSGMQFSETVTMQTGQVYEFYINFGWSGIIIGMMLYGAMLRYVDIRGLQCARSNDWLGFSRVYLVGITLVWPGDLFIAQFSFMAAAFVIQYCLGEIASSLEPMLRSAPIPGGRPRNR
jgi:hypothetical protein